MSVAMGNAGPTTSLHFDTIEARIREGMIVRCQEGTIGRVAGLAPDWSDQPTHLLVRQGSLVPREIALPLHSIAEVMPDQVVLHLRRRQIERVLPHITDDLLQADIREALHSSPAFHDDDAFLSIEVAVQEQVVALRGHVRTIWRALLAETIARQTPGVWEVQNHLIGDDELEDAVRQALARESRLHTPKISVQSTLGHLTLGGNLRTAEAVALALLVARRVPGVRSITNQIAVIQQPNPAPSWLIDGHALFAARRSQQAGVS